MSEQHTSSGEDPEGEGRIEAHTTFLNVDIDLTSDEPLDALIAALGDSVYVLHQSDEAPFTASLELSGEGAADDADVVLDGLLAQIEALPGEARAQWDRCATRQFNVGVQSGLRPHASEWTIPAATIVRLAAVGGDLVWTVYGAFYTAPSPSDEPVE